MCMGDEPAQSGLCGHSGSDTQDFRWLELIRVYVYMVKKNEMDIYLTQVTPSSAALLLKEQ